MKTLRSILALLMLSTVWLAAQEATPAPDAASPTPSAEAPPAAPSSAPETPAPAPAAPAAPAETAPSANPLAPAPAADATPAPVTTVEVVIPAAGTPVGIASASGPMLSPDEPMDVADFPNEEVRDILRKIADLYELNVVIPETLVGTTSVKLHKVTWQQIFKVVLEPLGFSYVVDASGASPIILVKNKTEIAAEPLETRVIKVNSATASELAKSLTMFLDAKSSPPETITPDLRTNFLIINARPAKMSMLESAIDRLDQPTQQVSIEAKFYELNADNTKDLGIQWGFNGTQLASVGWAWQQNISNGLGVINQSGALPLAQTINGATAAPVTAPANQNLNFSQPSAGLSTLIPAPVHRAADLAIFNQAQYNAVLIAMQNIDTARLVSSPTAVTLDNQEITIFIGTNITVVFPTVNNQTGQTTPGANTNYLVGTTMKVKPHVTNDGFINLTLNPELSRIELQSDTYFGGSYPRISSRKLTDANVSLKDGYTIAIGGLIDDTDARAIQQVPILGDIPVIGELFKSTRTIRSRKNLIIFVTAKTLSREGATYKDIINPEMLIRAQVTAQDIPGYWDSYHTGTSPGMAYATPEQRQTMADVQAARDAETAAKTQLLYLQQLKEAQEGEKKATKSLPTSTTKK